MNADSEPTSDEIGALLDAAVEEQRAKGYRVTRRGESVAITERDLGSGWIDRVTVLIDERGRTERRSLAGPRAEVAASPLDPGVAFQLGDDVVIRDYPGRSQADASQLYAREVEWAALCGYHPISQSWAEGRPGLGRMVAIGIYSMIARPKGVLTVTFRRDSVPEVGETKVCPDCAEVVKAAARVCRFCRYEFSGG